MAIEVLAMLAIKALIIGASIVIIAMLTWLMVRNWLSSHKNSNSDYGTLIKKRINNGDVRVVANVFSKHGTKRASQTWDAEEIDDELKRKFRHSNRIYV